MRLGARLARVEQAVRSRGVPGQYRIVKVVPVGRHEGLAPGLYRDGPEGSLVGLLVYDPAAGEPVIPEGRLHPRGMVVRLD